MITLKLKHYNKEEIKQLRDAFDVALTYHIAKSGKTASDALKNDKVSIALGNAIVFLEAKITG